MDVIFWTHDGFKVFALWVVVAVNGSCLLTFQSYDVCSVVDPECSISGSKKKKEEL